MKNVLLPLLVLWLVTPVFAQKIITKTLPLTEGQAVHLNLKFGDSIQVRYWDKPTISVRAAVLINNGKLDDALRVEATSTAEAVTVNADLDHQLMRQGKAADCPDRHPHTTVTNDWGDGSFSVCTAINYVIYLPHRAALRVETISGNINVTGASASVWAKSISGFVDVSWAGGQGATVALKTITGEAYSDLPINFAGKRPKHPVVGYLLEGTVLSGGPAVRLESISNDVFLRKAN